MLNIPEKIYLQVDEEPDIHDEFEEISTTWCADRIYKNDIEYILKSKYDELEKWVEELTRIVTMSCKLDVDNLTPEAFKDWYKDEIKILEEIKQKPIEEILKEVE